MDASDSLPGTETASPLRPAEPGARRLAGVRAIMSQAARLVAFWPAVVALLICLYQVSRPELWRDELASLSLSARTLPRLLAATRTTDAAQLPYYVVLHFWIAAFGDTVLAVRMLSVLAMAAAAACVALAGKQLFGPRAGLAAGLVFAIVPSVSRFGQEVRFYALATFAAALATLLLVRAIDRPAWWRWTFYAICVACLVYLDPVALTLLAGHAAVAAIYWRRRHPWRSLAFLPASIAGAAMTLPVILAGSKQAKAQIGWIQRPEAHLLPHYGANLFYSPHVAVAMVVLALLAWASRKFRATASATALAAVPVAAAWVASLGSVSYVFPRYLLFTVTAWALLAGAAIAVVRPPFAAAALVALAVLAVPDQQAIRLPGAHGWANYPADGGPFTRQYSYRAAAQVIARNLQRGDAIVYQAGRKQFLMIDYGVSYYLRHDLRPAIPLPHELFIAQTAAQRGSLYPSPCAYAATCAGHPRRVWIVDDGRVTNPYGTIPAAQRLVLRRSYGIAEILQADGMTVTLLTPSADPATRPRQGRSR